jgi:hypothetical protein
MNSYLRNIKRFEYLIALTGYIFIALFILNRILLSSPGTIGFFHDWPIGPYPEMNRIYANGGLYVWDSQIGIILFPTDWIFRVSLIPFSFLDGEVITKGLLLLVLTLSGFGAFCLGKQFKLSPFSSFAAGVLFIFSPIIFTRIVAGHIYYLIGYFLSPFIVTLFLRGREDYKEEKKKQEKQEQENDKEKKEPKRNKNNFKYFIIAGILTSFAAIQLHFLVMIFLVLLIFSIIDFGRIKRSTIGLIIVFSIAVLINLSPTVLSEVLYTKTSLSHFNPLLLLSFDEITQASNLTKSFRLLGYEVHSYSYAKIGTSEDPLFVDDIKKEMENKTNLVANPNFTLVGGSNTNNTSQSRLPANWKDAYSNCNSIFKCIVIKSKVTEPQNNNINSFQISTNETSTNKNTWSSIYGNEVDVKPNENYALLTHMKLNEFATRSHIAIEGYNETSKKWYQIMQCPSSTNGPLEWKGFNCELTIPADTTKIRPVLNAGWSSQPGKQAVTLFDEIEIIKLNDTSLIIPSWVFYLDFLIPIVGFSALIFRQDKYTISLAIISLIGLFLLKGPNPPLSGIFNFIFIHGFYIFRELWHIAFLYGFGISFLIAFFLERVIVTSLSSSKLKYYSSPLQHQYRIHHPFFSLKYSKLSRFVLYNKLKNYYKIILSLFLVSLIVVSNGYPLLIGNFGGYVQTYSLPKDYHTLYNKLLTNNTYNTLILPLFAPIQYSSSRLSGLDPLTTYSSSNIFYQDYDGPYYPLLGAITWLHTVMQENKTKNLGNLLSGFGIKYIILRKDFVSNYPHAVSLGNYDPFTKRWYSSLEPFLDAQKDLTVISNTTHYKIYENINEAKKFFISLNATNGLYDYRSLLHISNFTSLSKIAVFPSDYDVNNYTNSGNSRDERSTNDFIELGTYATSYSPTGGWTTNRDWFGYDYLLASRVHLGAFSMAHNSTISFDLPLPKKYQNKPIEMWMRALTWPKGKMVSISINGKESLYSLSSLYPTFSLIKIFEGRSTNALYHFLIRNLIGSNYIEGIYFRETNTGGDRQNINKIIPIGTQNKTNLVANPNFTLVGGSNTNNTSQSRLPANWRDAYSNCNSIFKCTGITFKETTGGQNKIISSLQISTNNTSAYKDKNWSWVYGNDIKVKPEEQYTVTAHMKLNEFATGSHIVMEGHNTTSNKWYQIVQCPSGTNGPLEWKGFNCELTIPEDTDKIRPILNAGWSSQAGKQAVTLFSDIWIMKLFDSNSLEDITQNSMEKINLNERLPLISNYTRLSPTHWHVYINGISKPFVLSFAEPYDSSWEANIYKNGKKVDVVNSAPSYSGINGFRINQTGNLDIVIKYGPQHWFEIGLMISGITLTCCLFYIMYCWIRNKRERWYEKLAK